MAIRLRQSTASQEIPLGYFLDSTDGNTEETALTIANTDIKLWKMGATTLANKNSGGATHISNGLYYCVLDATDTNTLGALIVFVHVSGALATRVECEVLPAVVYDAWIAGTDNFDVNVVQLLGTAWLTPGVAGTPDINVKQWSGTNVATPDTAGYPKITVKTGSGSGELDVISGVVKANLAQILGTALTETAGQIAAAFKQFFDVASPTGTMKAITNVVTTTNVTTVNDKTGYRLSATGVDDILDETATSVAGKPNTLRSLIWFMRKIWSNKRTYNKATNHQIIYEDDGTTAMLDATMVNDASEATRGAA